MKKRNPKISHKSTKGENLPMAKSLSSMKKKKDCENKKGSGTISSQMETRFTTWLKKIN